LVTVGNRGSTVEGAEVHRTDLPAVWWSFDPDWCSLLSCREANATLRLHLPRTTASKAGDYPIAVDLSDQLDRKAGAIATVAVEPFVKLSAQLKPENFSGRSAANHTFFSTRPPTSELRPGLKPLDKDSESSRFQPQASGLLVGTAETATTSLKMRARRLPWAAAKAGSTIQLPGDTRAPKGCDRRWFGVFQQVR
jgi:hypothetical protein